MVYKCVNMTEFHKLQNTGVMDTNSHWFYNERDAKRFSKIKDGTPYAVLEFDHYSISPAFVFCVGTNNFNTSKGVEIAVEIPIMNIRVARKVL